MGDLQDPPCTHPAAAPEPDRASGRLGSTTAGGGAANGRLHRHRRSARICDRCRRPRDRSVGSPRAAVDSDTGPGDPAGNGMDHIPPSSILRRTWRALLEPRRLAAVVLVSAALLLAQANFGGDPLAIPLGAAMCLAFVLVAPVSWRVLFPYGPQRGQLAVRLTLFAAVGTAVVLVVAMVVP